MPSAQLTPDEIVQHLKRTSGPTVVCEGNDDVVFYRELETLLGPTNVAVLPAGGRPALLKVFDRRIEFKNTPTLFFADRDMWVFSGVPPEYNEIHLTRGFSIENDLLASSPVEDLIHRNDLPRYRKCLDAVLHWFSFVVEQHSATGNCEFPHIMRVLEDGKENLCPVFCSEIGYVPADLSILNELRSHYRESYAEKRGSNCYHM